MSEPVKTRLASVIGEPEARNAYEQLLVQTVEAALACQAVSPILCLAGSLGHDSVDRWRRRWPELMVTQQSDGDLGQRMATALRSSESAKALLVGTDCPGVTAGYLNAAADALKTFDAVLGPVADGGYVLIGMHQVRDRLFSDIRWSTNVVAQVTRARLAELSMSFCELDELWDVDEAADYARWLARDID